MEHHEACTQKRCVAACEVAKFHIRLEEPLLESDRQRVEREQRRLAALAKGDIPEAV